MNLTKDLLFVIFEHISLVDIINFYKSKIFTGLTALEVIKILSKLNLIDRGNIYGITDEIYVLRLLNFLGKIYHSGLGFNCNIKSNDIFFFTHENYLYQDVVNLIRDSSYIKNTNKLLDDFKPKLLDLNHYFSIDKDYAIMKSRFLVSYKFINLIYKVQPSEWYNKPYGQLYCNKTQEKLLPFLNTKPYIIVNDSLITISAELKGSPITIDDILFATRGFARDETRTVACEIGYKLISIKNECILLKCCMDNHST